MLKTERNISNAVVDGRAATLVFFYLDQSEARSAVTSFASIEVLGNWPPTPPLSHNFALSEK